MYECAIEKKEKKTGVVVWSAYGRMTLSIHFTQKLPPEC